MLLREAQRRGRRTAGGGHLTIALSCRVRLARNLADERYPDWAAEETRRTLFDRITRAAQDAACLEKPEIHAVGDLDDVALDVLCERRLASHDLASRGPGAGVIVSSDHAVSIMVNEEDHLRIQVIQPGMDLMQAWQTADAIDSCLERRLAYAFDPRLGYLTACPSNVGTGLRASVMVHLLGLRLANDLDAVLRGLDRLRLAVRGVGGEGSDAAGHMFQISNQGTLGQDEAGVIAELTRLVSEVVRHERNARLRLVRDADPGLVDCVARALALLQHGRVMGAEEALDYLSALRLGVELGMLRRVSIDTLERLALLVQPGHLQQRAGRKLEAPERDVMRADWLRTELAAAELRA